MLSTSTGAPILEGYNYKVNASGTSNREWWTVKEVDASKPQVTAKGDKTPHVRTFYPHQFGEMKESKQIISESVSKVTTLMGAEMWVERIIWWPPQKRRGRPTKEG